MPRITNSRQTYPVTTGVVFDGGDFADAVFSGGTVSFRDAKFSGGDVSFWGTQFSGGSVNFEGAEFSGGEVNFNGAEFSGGEVGFDHARFSGGGRLLYRRVRRRPDRLRHGIVLAEWEWALREALQVLVGLPVLVIPVGGAADAPSGWRRELREFLLGDGFPLIGDP